MLHLEVCLVTLFASGGKTYIKISHRVRVFQTWLMSLLLQSCLSSLGSLPDVASLSLTTACFAVRVCWDESELDCCPNVLYCSQVFCTYPSTAAELVLPFSSCWLVRYGSVLVCWMWWRMLLNSWCYRCCFCWSVHILTILFASLATNWFVQSSKLYSNIVPHEQFVRFICSVVFLCFLPLSLWRWHHVGL